MYKALQSEVVALVMGRSTEATAIENNRHSVVEELRIRVEASTRKTSFSSKLQLAMHRQLLAAGRDTVRPRFYRSPL